MVIEARSMSDAMSRRTIDDDKEFDTIRLQQSLDALGYEEAAQYVYGMPYEEWKKRYSKKVPDDTLQKFNQSKSLWATHDKTRLTKRAEPPLVPLMRTTKAVGASSLRSNVCCQQDPDELSPPSLPSSSQPPMVVPPPSVKPNSRSRELPPYQPPVPPELSFSLGILTVSDRAAKGEYETGDLSGPAVRSAVEALVALYHDRLTMESVWTEIVPDEVEAIQKRLQEWTDQAQIQLILTTGGTGFSPRDVTPEATNGIVDRVCDGLVTFCTMECAKVQPLASLSRGSAGVRGKSLIVNLPGNPQGVQEIIPILLPLALQAVKDLC